MQKRQSNYELLRIVAMCMIIAMHYLTKGMQLPKLSVDSSVTNHMWWLLYAACNVAVNAYVLITGYFLIDSEWRIGKIVYLICEVLVYAWGVPLVLGAVGCIDLGALSFGEKLTILLPIEQEHYWFATSYVMLYLLAPILSAAVKHMEEKQLRITIIALVTMFGGLKSINPYLIPWDKYGYDVLWFICLFLTAGYIKLYGIKWFDTKLRSVGTYVAAVLATWGIAAICGYICRITGKLEYYMDMSYAYNYVTVYIASIALFYTFKHMENIDSKIVNRLASYTFGVYLLHENIEIRQMWPEWLGITHVDGGILQVLHLIFCVVTVFAAGAVVDALRSGIFKAFMRLGDKRHE